jgi:hypothetical protein
LEIFICGYCDSFDVVVVGCVEVAGAVVVVSVVVSVDVCSVVVFAVSVFVDVSDVVDVVVSEVADVSVVAVDVDVEFVLLSCDHPRLASSGSDVIAFLISSFCHIPAISTAAAPDAAITFLFTIVERRLFSAIRSSAFLNTLSLT